MKRALLGFIFLFLLFLLATHRRSNYAARHSSIPGVEVSGLEAREGNYAFEHTLIGRNVKSVNVKANPTRMFEARVEIAHLNDSYPRGMPEGGSRRSVLRFVSPLEGGMEVDPESVVLRHETVDGEVIKPLAVNGNLNQPRSRTGGFWAYYVTYPGGLPEQLIEVVEFDLMWGGERKSYAWRIPLELRPDYVPWWRWLDVNLFSR